MSYVFDFSTAACCQIAVLGDIYEQYIGYKEDGYFVEIGAFDGLGWSNTMPLIEAGWSGIMVEPNPLFFVSLNARHGANKKLSLIEGAVGRASGRIKFYSGGSISTTQEGMIDVFRKCPGTPLTDGMNENVWVEVAAYSMDDLLKLCHCPKKYDVLSVDVEGGEKEVLEGYDIDKHRPKLVIIELSDDHPSFFLKYVAWWARDYFARNHYERIYYDNMNAIYLDKQNG